MKRIVAFLLCLLMVFSVAACASEEPNTTETLDSAESQNEAVDKKTQEDKKTEDQYESDTTPDFDLNETEEEKTEEEKKETEKTSFKVYKHPSTYVPSTTTTPSFGNANKIESAVNPTFETPILTPPTKYTALTENLSSYPTSSLTNKLTAAKIENIPVATNEMSSDELRQIVVDYMQLQLSFQWTPSTTTQGLTQGSIYSGLTHQSGASGNLYRFLEYYDESTGIFYAADALQDNGNDFSLFASDNALAVSWAWSRVINSATFKTVQDMNVYSKFIPVGAYTYSYTNYKGVAKTMFDIDKLGTLTKSNAGYYKNASDAKKGKKTPYGTEEIIQDWIALSSNQNAMLDCYKQLKPADALVNNTTVLMVKSVDATAQKVVVFQQSADNKEITYTFAQLQDLAYVPFTFAEFHKDDAGFWAAFTASLSGLGLNETDAAKKETTFREKEAVEESTITTSSATRTISIAGLESVSLTSKQYPISDLFITAKDEYGNILAVFTYRTTATNVMTIKFSDIYASLKEAFTPYAGAKNTLVGTLQLSNGQLQTAFTSTLT